MISNRDGHIRVLPLHVANKIAAGEVVERPASVAKELVENAIDAGAKKISISIVQGGRKLVAVQDDGCGMSREDAVLSLERQATSKIRDVGDIEQIDTLGFRGEAIPSIAAVSRFTLTTRRHDSDEGTRIQVNAGILAEVCVAGCPPGTIVEVRDLFCNVPARRKFLKAFATEENHVKQIFTVHALAHPDIGFALSVDGRELYRLAPAADAAERIRELLGADAADNMLPISFDGAVKVSGFIERPNLSTPTRRDQYIFVNGRPASAPSIAYAIKEAFPKRQADTKPAAVIFLRVPPDQVDVNVHPTKREVRFRDNTSVKNALATAIGNALASGLSALPAKVEQPGEAAPVAQKAFAARETTPPKAAPTATEYAAPPQKRPETPPLPEPAAVAVDLPLAAAENDSRAKPWAWFHYLATTASGYLLIETDAGVVTINPHAARERIAFEQLKVKGVSQSLLIPETVQLSPPDFARLNSALQIVESMGFKLEPFGRDTFKIEAIPQLIDGLSPTAVITTIAKDLADGATRRIGERWRENLVAKSVAKSFAGMSLTLTEEGATRLVEELASCTMPYVCPRGKPTMIFTSTRELNRKFAKD